MIEILEHRDQWETTFRQGWLAHYQQTGETNWKLYKPPANETAPSGPGVDLRASRLLLITTSGAYLREMQTPFDAPNLLGDYTIRLFPTASPFEALAYAHEHYDHTAVNQDPQVLIPLRHLESMVAEGKIGSLAESVISFSGYHPDVTRVIDETIPAILEAARALAAQAALLAPA